MTTSPEEQRLLDALRAQQAREEQREVMHYAVPPPGQHHAAWVLPDVDASNHDWHEPYLEQFLHADTMHIRVSAGANSGATVGHAGQSLEIFLIPADVPDIVLDPDFGVPILTLNADQATALRMVIDAADDLLQRWRREVQ